MFFGDHERCSKRPIFQTWTRKNHSLPTDLSVDGALFTVVVSENAASGWSTVLQVKMLK